MRLLKLSESSFFVRSSRKFDVNFHKYQLLASSWYLWKLTSNFLDEPTKKELTNSFNNLKNKISEGKQNFSKAKLSEAWEKYKEEGGALSNKEKS